MKLQSDVRAKACTTTIALPEVLDGPGRHHLQHIGGPLTCIVIGIVLSLLIAVGTYPASVKADAERAFSAQARAAGETVGLTFRFNALSLFDAQTGMALQTANQPSVNEERATHG